MRRILLLLTPLLLTACIKQSASYYIGDSDHALTVRAEQLYFWEDTAQVTVVAAHLPDCQRQIALASLPLDELTLEVFSPGENIYTLRAGAQLWQIDAANCTQLPAPAPNAVGEPVGVFHMSDDDKMVFEAAVAAAATPAAAAPPAAPAAPSVAPPAAPSAAPQPQ